jgi:hypothetical protein
MKLPNIQIDWGYFKTIDEAHIDDMRVFGMILLTIVKDNDVQILCYEIDTKQWGLLQQ